MIKLTLWGVFSRAVERSRVLLMLTLFCITAADKVMSQGDSNFSQWRSLKARASGLSVAICWLSGRTHRAVRWLMLAMLLVMVEFGATSAWAAGTLRVGYYDLSPLVFRDPTGKPQGLFIDVLTHIGQKENWELTFVHGTWPESLGRLQSGDIDLLVSVSYTDERAKTLDFSQDAIATDWGVIYKSAGSKIESITDLAGGRISVIRNGIYTGHFKRLSEQFDIKMQFVERNDYAEVIADVEVGSSIAGIGSNIAGVILEGQKVVRSGIVFSPVQVMFATKKGSRPEVIASINRHVGALKADPESVYFQYRAEWIDARPSSAVPDWIIYLAVVILVVTVALVVFVLLLKRQVHKKTASLQESQQNLAITLHSIGDAVIATDTAGRITRMNPTAERLTSWSLTDALGQPLTDVFRIISAQTRLPSVNPVQLVLERGEVVGLANHTALLARDGREYQIADSAAPIRNPAGDIVGVVLVFSDVTEKYAAEETLRLTRFSVEAAADALFWMTPDGRIVDVNAGACRTLGYTREELLQLSVSDVDTHYNAELWPQHFAELRKQGSLTFESEQRTKDGRLIPVEIVANFVSHGSEERNCAFVRDITERKRAQVAALQLNTELANKHNEVLLAQESAERFLERLRIATRAASIGIWDWNIVDNDLIWDNIIHELYGVPCDFFKGGVEGWSEYIHPDDRSMVLRELQTALRGEQEYAPEFRIVLPDGSIHDIKANSQTFFENGKPIRMVGTNIDITERKQAKRVLAEQKAIVELILEQSLAGYWDWWIQKNEEYLSPTFKKMFGYEDHEMPNTPEAWQKIIFPEDLPGVLEVFNRHAQSRGEIPFYNEVRYRHKDGSTVWVICTGRVIEWDDQDQPVRMIGCHIDTTKIRQAQEKLHLAASVFTHAREGITITDAAGSILDVNEAFTRITGYGREEAIGQNPRMLQSGRQDRSFYAAMWDALTEKGHWSGEIWNRRKDGEVFAELITISSVKDAAGTLQRYVALFSDITAVKEHQSQLEHMAHFDALTNLPNRLLLADRLQQAMAQAQRRGQRLAVAYLDLDGFKVINDRHGHALGDQVLIALATGMKDCLREGDTLARLGGDEFVAVLIDLEDASDSVPMLNRLLAATAESVPIGELSLQVSASLGVTFYPQAQDIDADQLLRQADQAMYQAKLAGKSRYQIFDAEQDSSIRVQHESLQRIRLALAQGELVLHYQPKVNMHSGTVIGAEALIRWQHPEKGLLAPMTFLPVIEDHPLAVDVGEWVIDAALTQMETWHAAGLDLPVSVNISARQLQQADFVARLQAILSRHPHVRPGCIELEILETSALADMAQVSQVIEDCALMGVKFALDDFGTGYSSLTYLKQLRVALLKIDQSFVRDMLDDPDDLAILQGVIGLASAFKREVIAEGVETVAHGTALLQLGCELAQGYGIARPMPPEQLPAWVATWQPDAGWCALPWLGGQL